MLQRLILGTLFGKHSLDMGLIEPSKISAIRKGRDNTLVVIIDGAQQIVPCPDEKHQALYLKQIEKFSRAR